jgi:hypothetical protein
MHFRPSALSNPQQVLTYKPKMPTTRVLQRPIPKPSVNLQPINIPSAGGDEGEEKEEEGLSMPVKVAIGAGVAAVLGLLVYRLVR